PGWREFLPMPGTPWSKRARPVSQFHETKGRWPSQTSSDDDERGLGVWLSNQRSQAHRNELPERRRAALDQHLPDWDTGSREQAWRLSADALGAFVYKHNKWPSKSAANKEERQLGSWLHNRRQDARTGRGWTPE